MVKVMVLVSGQSGCVESTFYEGLTIIGKPGTKVQHFLDIGEFQRPQTALFWFVLISKMFGFRMKPPIQSLTVNVVAHI